MTPLAKWLTKTCPTMLRVPVLISVYTLILLAVFLLLGVDTGPAPYVDIGGK